jgi:hypothetical protein
MLDSLKKALEKSSLLIQIIVFIYLFIDTSVFFYFWGKC